MAVIRACAPAILKSLALVVKALIPLPRAG